MGEAPSDGEAPLDGNSANNCEGQLGAIWDDNRLLTTVAGVSLEEDCCGICSQANLVCRAARHASYCRPSRLVPLVTLPL